MNYTPLTQTLLAIAIAASSLPLVPVTSFANPPETLQAQANPNHQITEKKLIEAAKSLETAWDKRDVNGFMQTLAPFAISKLIFESEGNAQTLYITGEAEHRDFFTQALKQPRSTEKKKIQEQLRISPDGTVGTVRTSTISFVTTADNRRWIVTSEDTINFGIVGDRVVAISIDSSNRFNPRPSPR